MRFAAIFLIFIVTNSYAVSKIDRKLSDQELLWQEAIATNNGHAYRVVMRFFPSEADARGCLSQRAICNKKSPGYPVDRLEYVEMTPPLREAIDQFEGFDAAVIAPYGEDGSWIMLDIVDSLRSEFPVNVDQAAWLKTNAAKVLPSAKALRKDPVFALRRVMNQVRTVAELEALVTDGHVGASNIDAPLSNGLTLLIAAVSRNDRALAEALVRHGADVNRCVSRTCPLNEAVIGGYLDLARFLLSAGARVNGDGQHLSPLMYAAANADKDMSMLLLDAGADVLAASRFPLIPGSDIRVPRSVIWYAPAAQPEYLEWLQARAMGAVQATGRWEWKLFVEQGDKVLPVEDGATIKLQPAPFRLVLRMNEKAALWVLTSSDPALLTLSRGGVYRRELVRPFAVGASSRDSKFLVVLPKAEPVSDSVSVSLHYSDDPADNAQLWRRDSGNGPEYVYEVEELIEDRQEIPLGNAGGRRLSLLAGINPAVGWAMDMYAPLRFTIEFAASRPAPANSRKKVGP